MTLVLCVPERGRIDVSSDDLAWRAVENHPAFWSLVQSKIVAVSRPSKGRVRLEGSKYVGRALVGDVLVEVTEKVHGALLTVLEYATGGEIRTERGAAPRSDLGRVAGLLVHHFVRALGSYAAAGREFTYSWQRQTSTLVGGRLDVARTIRLRASGRGHLVAFARQVIAYDTPTNRLLRAALMEVEVIARVVDVSPEDLAAARGLAMLFADCLSADVLYAKRADLATQAAELGRQAHEAARRDLLALAEIILLRASFEHQAPLGSAAPRMWFLDIETAFESAVLRIAERLVQPPLTVTHGSKLKPRIFSDANHTANPDLVFRAEGAVRAIADTKYKEWEGRPEGPDLYQLRVHAEAFHADRCFLVYPDQGYGEVYLGSTAGGAHIWAFALSLAELETDLSRALRTVGVLDADPTAAQPLPSD